MVGAEPTGWALGRDRGGYAPARPGWMFEWVRGRLGKRGRRDQDRWARDIEDRVPGSLQRIAKDKKQAIQKNKTRCSMFHRPGKMEMAQPL